MGSTMDDMGIVQMGVENNGQEDSVEEETHREPEDMVCKSVASSVYDGNKTPLGSQSPGAFESRGDSVPDSSQNPPNNVLLEGKKGGSSFHIEESPEGPGVSSQPPRGDPLKTPEVTFRKGHKKATADHPRAAKNKVLDDDDAGKRNQSVQLDILGDPAGAEVDTTKPEGVAKGDACLGRSNPAVDDDDTEETGF